VARGLRVSPAGGAGIAAPQSRGGRRLIAEEAADGADAGARVRHVEGTMIGPSGATPATADGRLPEIGASAAGADHSRREGGEVVGRLVSAAMPTASALLIVFLLLPMAALVWRVLASGEGVSAAEAQTLHQALKLSLVTSLLTLTVSLALGTPLAYLLARRRFRGARLVDTLVDLPVVLPPAVAGIALLMAFGRYGLVGRILDRAGFSIGFTTVAVVLAQLFVAVPYYVRAAKSGFARVERGLEEAAADLGAPPSRVFRSVTLPLALPGLAAGAVLAWARALGEFGATIMFAGNLPGITQTMPLAVYARFSAGDLRSALLLALTLLGASMLILLGARLFHGGLGDVGS
jgi:molybdate transport system permease protein